MFDEKIKIVVIEGPTASGKTAIGVELATIFGGEVISADSMQIYKGMDIATAKPKESEIKGVPHHLIDFLEPTDCYSVVRYVDDAKNKAFDISSRNKLPFLVGGTGLYINSLIDGISFGEEILSIEFRNSLLKEAEEKGNEVLFERLKLLDPEICEKLHPNNLGRVIRAIEVYTTTGKTMTQVQTESKIKESCFTPLIIGLNFKNRQTLYDRINYRVDLMLKEGLLEEAKSFSKNPYSKTAQQAIGIKELSKYLDGEEDLYQAVERIKKETRNYAKRQLTWFRRDERVNWIYIDECENFSQVVKKAQIIVEKFIK